MNDNALFALLRTVITAGITAQGLTAPLTQQYQPTIQGTILEPGLYIYKLFDNRYGAPFRKNKFATDTMTHTETEIIETTFQLSGLTIQNPADTTQLTAADYVRAAARTLQSDTAIASLWAARVGIYRITQIRQINFSDDFSRFETQPSFDFTITREETLTEIITSTDTVEPSVHVIN